MAGPRHRSALAAVRKASGHTQESLAAALRVDRTTVGRWEAGERIRHLTSSRSLPGYWVSHSRNCVHSSQLTGRPATSRSIGVAQRSPASQMLSTGWTNAQDGLPARVIGKWPRCCRDHARTPGLSRSAEAR